MNLCIEIAMNTGLRKGEILALKWDWIDLNKKNLIIPQEKIKNRRGLRLLLGERIVGILRDKKRWIGRKENQSQ